ncbi:MAG: ornithine carbamoyltransferase [Bacteroidota bacterium]
MKRDFVSFQPYSSAELTAILSLTQQLKSEHRPHVHPLLGKTAALIFEKPSLRTRVSFEVGIGQLGGQAVFLSQESIGMGSREAVRDVAEMLSGYCDLVVARTLSHETVAGLADYGTVPVINALTDLLHPCQILADAFTLMERALLTPRTKIAFIGDGNNIVNSWVELAEKFPLHFVLACPPGYEPDQHILARTRSAGISTIEIVHDPFEAAEQADVLYTDVWVSMGQENEMMERRNAFKEYQISRPLLSAAKPDCVVMHCLPAHRGEEIAADVLEGDHSIVRDQAINRLHVQNGIMTFLFTDGMQDSIKHQSVESLQA